VTSRVLLGTWVTPRQNSVDVFLTDADGRGLRHLCCEWDTLPLSPADVDHWTTMILPEVVRTSQLYLGRIGAALVVRW
jgi:hypothetical protein